MVLTKPVGLAMAAQVSRVNSGGAAPDVYEQLRQAREQIRVLVAAVQALQAARVGITGTHGRLVTPKEFAAQHGVTVSTINRALNAGELLSERQANGRWLVYADQPYQPQRHRR